MGALFDSILKGQRTVEMVRVPPGVVGSEDEGVGDKSDGVVDRLVVGESAVSSIVSNTEDGATGEALEPPVGSPKTPLEGGERVGVEGVGSLNSLNERVDLFGSLKSRNDVSSRC